ncbi:glycerol-3-phosphate 1-O-acyltransferase PlsY [Angustibacter peucedani]
MNDPAPWVVAALVVGGYLLGAVNPAAILARARGVDLRAFGSGNPGATNVARVLGRRWGVVVGLLDVAKGAGPALLALALVGRPWAYAVAAAAVLGHVTSPFLKGRGGKGVATSLGVLLALGWLWLVAVVVVFVVVVSVTRWVAGASVAAAMALLPVCLVLPPVWGGEADRWSRLFGVLLVLVVLGRHRTNLLLRWMARKTRIST